MLKNNDNDQIILDDNFQKCLINKAFEIEAISTQRELLYTLTSGSSLIQIYRTMLIYIDADIQRLKTIPTTIMNSNQCLQFYAKETLCPICIKTSSSSNQINNNGIDEPLCENDCQYLIKTCFNQTNNPYIEFASIAKGYSAIIKETEHAITELKVNLYIIDVESKIHLFRCSFLFISAC